MSAKKFKETLAVLRKDHGQKTNQLCAFLGHKSNLLDPEGCNCILNVYNLYGDAADLINSMDFVDKPCGGRNEDLS